MLCIRRSQIVQKSAFQNLTKSFSTVIWFLMDFNMIFVRFLCEANPYVKLTSISTVVPTPTVEVTFNLSTFFWMFGNPIPAPNPISLTF